MNDRQHVGAQAATYVPLGDLLDTERARQAALAAIAKPTAARDRGVRDSGNGDRCPLSPSHGKMYVLGETQYCSHHTHDNPPMTRCFWPLNGFDAAVAAYQPPKPKEAT